MSIVQLLVSHGADLKISDHTGTGLYPSVQVLGYIQTTQVLGYIQTTQVLGYIQTTQVLGYIRPHRHWVISISTGTRTAE